MLPSSRMHTWDASRQETYRAQHPESTFTFHVLLDASYSMGEHEASLRSAYNMYLRWLQRHAPAMSLVDLRCFGSTLHKPNIQPLGMSQPLDIATYSADYGGTALYDSIGQVVTQTSEPGQHILVIFTDGLDGDSQSWSPGQVHELLTTLQNDHSWLAVFLGAFPQALDVASTLGFLPGNCLVFGTEQIPDAFERLKRATERYLVAPPQERKLLVQSGVFR